MWYESELEKNRRAKWRVDAAVHSEHPLRTLDEAREFVNAMGFCLLYPTRPAMLAPTFIGAYQGSLFNLPLQNKASVDERALEANLLIVRLLNEKSAFEVAFGGDATLLVSAAEFPYFYALVGERNPKQPPSAGSRGDKALTNHAFTALQDHGPLTADELQERLGKAVSENAVAAVLLELWAKLRITRIPSGAAIGSAPRWEMLWRWAPEAVNRGKNISAGEALSALISRYLETVLAAEQKDIEDFFGRIAPRSRVTEMVRGLLTARELSFVKVEQKSMVRLTPRPGTEAAEEEKLEPVRSVSEPTAERKPYPPRGERPRFKRPGVERPNFERPNSEQPSFERKSSDRPRFDKPRFDKPSVEKPRFDKPRFGKSRFDKPKFDRPRFAGPASGQSGSDRPRFSKTRTDKPGFAKPGFAKSGFAKSGFAKPGFAKQGFDRPRFKKPGFDKSRSEGPSSDRPNFAKPGSARANSGTLKSEIPKSNRPIFNRHNFGKSGPDRPKFSKSRSDKPGFDRPRFEKSGFDKPKSRKPEFEDTGLEQPKSAKPKFYEKAFGPKRSLSEQRKGRPKFSASSSRPRSESKRSGGPGQAKKQFGAAKSGPEKSGSKKFGARPFHKDRPGEKTFGEKKPFGASKFRSAKPSGGKFGKGGPRRSGSSAGPGKANFNKPGFGKSKFNKKTDRKRPAK